MLAVTARLWPVVWVTAVPIILLREFWSAVLVAGWPRALDGSGHFALARIEAALIFPDTFGWTDAFFMGMPFPNFYPPLFYWTIGLLARLGLADPLVSLKLLVALPLVLMPAVLWWACGAVCARAPVRATAAALSLFPLLQPFFHGPLGSGLNYNDTFATGLYTQPLAFLILLAWLRFYCGAGRFTPPRVIGCAFLLALVILTNFFTALVGFAMAGFVFASDLWQSRGRLSHAAVGRAAAVVSAVVLVLFWLVPMLLTYDYFVTRPLSELPLYVTPQMAAWYALGSVGLLLWMREPARPASFIALCWGMLATLLLSRSLAPQWFPLQPFRLAPAVTFCFSLPAAYALVRLAGAVPVRRPRGLSVAAGLVVLALAGLVTATRSARLVNRYLTGISFYVGPDRTALELSPREQSEWIARHPDWGPQMIDAARAGMGNPAGSAALTGILSFARHHRDGRYLVEVPDGMDSHYRVFDSRAITSYLGAQGNQAAGAVFREASPSSLFVNAQVNALSADVDSFGISSVLADDIDFAEQPLDRHLARVAWLGVRYLVIFTGQMRAALDRHPLVVPVYSRAGWSVYRLHGTAPLVEPLRYLPALVFAPMTVKARTTADSTFIRFAEEQFADGWFDVPLVRSSMRHLDGMAHPESFGALIVTRYDCNDCEAATRLLERFAASRPLILFRGPGQLFRRLAQQRSRLPLITVLELPGADSSEPVRTQDGPTRRYGTAPFRAAWRQIRAILDAHRQAAPTARIAAQYRGSSLHVDVAPSPAAVPILIRQTHHPRWVLSGGEELYASSPMFSLAFASAPLRLEYRRTGLERAALVVSFASALGLAGAALVAAARRRLQDRGRQ